MRLRLRKGHFTFGAIYFSANPQSVSIAQGDFVDVAFNPQVNEYRGDRIVQMNVLDIRPSCRAECSPETSLYRTLQKGEPLSRENTACLPDRAMLAMVWRYLAGVGTEIQESPLCLCRKIVRSTGVPMRLETLLTCLDIFHDVGKPLSLGQLSICLDIFRDVGLLEITRLHKSITIRLTPGTGKADLTTSQTMQRLLRAKES